MRNALVAVWFEAAYQCCLILRFGNNPDASIVARAAFLYGYDP